MDRVLGMVFRVYCKDEPTVAARLVVRTDVKSPNVSMRVDRLQDLLRAVVAKDGKDEVKFAQQLFSLVPTLKVNGEPQLVQRCENHCKLSSPVAVNLQGGIVIPHATGNLQLAVPRDDPSPAPAPSNMAMLPAILHLTISIEIMSITDMVPFDKMKNLYIEDIDSFLLVKLISDLSIMALIGCFPDLDSGMALFMIPGTHGHAWSDFGITNG